MDREQIGVNNMDKDKLLEYLEIMCKRCTNNEICQGTGCTPKKEIKKYIEEKGQ